MGTKPSETLGSDWALNHPDFVLAYNRTLETEDLPLEEWATF